jgi:RNA polymerase sigma-70 factor (ECF subfamily)
VFFWWMQTSIRLMYTSSRSLPGSQATARPAAAMSDPRFEAWFEAGWGRLHAVLTRLTGDAAEAEDLALEAFWRLHEQPPRLPADPAEADRAVSGWLYRVALNLGYNALRAGRRRSSYEEAAGRWQVEAHEDPDPAQQHERAQERRAVRAALAALKPKSAQILALRYSDFSYTEIAGVLQIAPGSVGTLLARAEAEFAREYRRLTGGVFEE